MSLPFTNKINENRNHSLLLALLENGCSFDQARKLLSIQETSLQSYVSKAYGHLKNIHTRIRKYLNDETCLRIWMVLKEAEDENKSRLVKRGLYPCFLCLFTFASLVFFRTFFVPNIKSFISTSEFNSSFLYLDILLTCLTIIYLTVLASVISLRITLKNRSLQNYVYMRLHHHFRDNLLTVYTSGQFSTLLSSCMSHGVSTQTSLEIIAQFCKWPFVAYLAQDCTSKLSSGLSFSQAVVTLKTDQAFKVFIQLGIYSNKVEEQLEHYSKFYKLHIENKVSHAINALYMYVYIQFFLSALVLYQIIQIPLTFLASIF